LFKKSKRLSLWHKVNNYTAAENKCSKSVNHCNDEWRLSLILIGTCSVRFNCFWIKISKTTDAYAVAHLMLLFSNNLVYVYSRQYRVLL